MALLVDKDGKETVGGIQQLRDAFQNAAGGKLAVSAAHLRYDHSQGANGQVLEFSGHFSADGKPFAVSSDPIPAGAPLAPVARALAISLLERSA